MAIERLRVSHASQNSKRYGQPVKPRHTAAVATKITDITAVNQRGQSALWCAAAENPPQVVKDSSTIPQSRLTIKTWRIGGHRLQWQALTAVRKSSATSSLMHRMV
ncbi:uncharacterized protein ATNIH1004_000062 [Aspergillus tanneri]|uniref:Uncharacterized protein n=1 Tax=Aspergillus tanneri TaxID=1220188 RepID=A0A5M9N0Q9_9EURO|nr:uncharacterized protein ATNIH1004_000062 [Aspergillus tanneri]KAA8651184.1 hypothetical protein ATNIH1004_000062 [Aspergillus tanneri]